MHVKKSDKQIAKDFDKLIHLMFRGLNVENGEQIFSLRFVGRTRSRPLWQITFPDRTIEYSNQSLPRVITELKEFLSNHTIREVERMCGHLPKQKPFTCNWNRWIPTALKHIQNNYPKKVSVPKIAESIGISDQKAYRHLSKSISKYNRGLNLEIVEKIAQYFGYTLEDIVILAGKLAVIDKSLDEDELQEQVKELKIDYWQKD